MTFKEFWTKVKDNIWAVLVAIGGIILAILGIRKGKANKQSEKDKKLADDIGKEKENVKEEIKQIENTVSNAEKVIEEAKEEVKKSEDVSKDVKSQIQKNESILEKYK